MVMQSLSVRRSADQATCCRIPRRQVEPLTSFTFSRYTSIVQRYVDSLANCLRDPSPLVRRQVLTLLTR